MPPLLRRNPSRHLALPVVGLRQLESSLAQLDQDLRLLDQLLPPTPPGPMPPGPLGPGPADRRQHRPGERSVDQPPSVPLVN